MPGDVLAWLSLNHEILQLLLRSGIAVWTGLSWAQLACFSEVAIHVILHAFAWVVGQLGIFVHVGNLPFVHESRFIFIKSLVILLSWLVVLLA
jgi:hypothetical protein